MKQAMIFAAGLGTRLRPLTDTMPKALVRVGGEPLLHRVIMNLKSAGFERIVVNVHHFAEQIIDYLKTNDNFGLDIRISDESDVLLDTGGGIRKAAPLFDPSSPILIHNVDILHNVDLATFYESAISHDATLMVSKRETSRYLIFNDDMRLRAWINIKTGEVRPPHPPGGELTDAQDSPHWGAGGPRFAFSGLHIFSPRLFPLMAEWPDKFGIIDFYLDACQKADIRGILNTNLRLLDVGKLDSLSEAEKIIHI